MTIHGERTSCSKLLVSKLRHIKSRNALECVTSAVARGQANNQNVVTRM